MSTEENKALVRRWFAETDKGNDAIIDELCAPDYVDHSPPLPGMGSGNDAVRKANAALADDVAWLCGQLGVEKPVVVGHSMGGNVALELAARHPALPAAVVAVDSPIVPP